MEPMLRPAYLNSGDTIGIISTARKMQADELDYAVQQLNNAGFKVKIGKSIGLTNDQFAGTDAERLNDLIEMLEDEEVQAILCARGGYGTARMLRNLPDGAFRKANKWICGFSDVTALHNLCAKEGLQSLHAIMPISFNPESVDSVESLINALKGQPETISVPPNQLNKSGVAEGLLAGGNLSVLYSLRAGKLDLDFQGKLLFIEDIDEYLYHIDRMLLNFELSGVFKQICGLIVGGMSDMNDNSIPFGKTAEEIICEYASKYAIPVAFGFPVGHTDDNLCMVLGANAQLRVDDSWAELRYL